MPEPTYKRLQLTKPLVIVTLVEIAHLRWVRNRQYAQDPLLHPLCDCVGSICGGLGWACISGLGFRYMYMYAD